MNGTQESHALVLSGGGARGAYEAGVVAALSKSETFDLIVGTSIGAINAAFCAQNEIAALTQLWQTIAAQHVIAPVDQVSRAERFLQAFEDFTKLPPLAKATHIPNLLLLWMQIGSKDNLLKLLGVLNRAPITALLQGSLNLNALKSSLVVTASDVTACTPIALYAFAGAQALAMQTAFCQNAGIEVSALSTANYLSAIEASAAIPGAFSPVQMNLGTSATRLFVDGGVANNTPLNLAISAGATKLTVVFVDPVGQAPTVNVENLVDIATSSFAIMQAKILETDLKLARMTNVALGSAQPPAGKRDVPIRIIRPSTELTVGTLDFDQQPQIDQAFALGLSDGTSPPAFSSS
jgi:NTE family protein